MKLSTQTLILALCSTLVATGSADAALIVTSQALELGDIEASTSTSGVFGTSATTGASAIDGVTTTRIGANDPGGTDPIIFTYQAVHADATFTYDISAQMFQFDGTTVSAVGDRLNGGEIMPNSGLAGQDRQRIDGPGTVGAGKWEFARFIVSNVQVISGGPVNIVGFSAFNVDTDPSASSGSVEDVNNGGNVIGSWSNGLASQSNVIDLSSNSTTAIDLVGTSTGTGKNTNQPNGFAVDFEIVPEPSSLALLGLGGLLISARRRRN